MAAPLSPESFRQSIINAIMSNNAVVPGRAELPDDSGTMRLAELEGSPSRALSSSSVGDGSSGYEASLSSGNQRTCIKKQGNINMKSGKAKDCHVKTVTSSDVESSENAETTESAGDETTDGSNKSSPKAKNKNKKCNATKSMPSTDDESSAQTEEASTDADTSGKSSQASTKDPNWSVSEDCRLRGMKEAGETWKFITTSLCKTKTDVRARWKVLQSQSSASGPTTEAEKNNATTDEETGDDVTEAEAEENETNEDEDDYENDEDDDEYEDDDEESDSNVKDSASANNNNKWHKGPRNDKVAIENKWAKARAKAKTSDQGDSVASGQEASTESSVSSSCLGYGDPEKEKQRRYLQDHIYKEMYPAEIHPKPDAYLGKRDCDVLASIDSKYKKSRWLEMQANFYNVTGRMVPLEAIRARCERAEAEKEERSEARKLQKRLDKVEDWIAKQSHEDSEE
ncbi:uncharacterized protein FTOL_04824 [Fusarium torulosum]|uniref:Myb-like domain-containing protein n=1 Tax=Fusarium torulosum TaxID=33205 RepID=A0AAE8M6H2_9HYPO|nr:uncharacterized protein FTOL_04824 [Fusarium torulosum]